MADRGVRRLDWLGSGGFRLRSGHSTVLPVSLSVRERGELEPLNWLGLALDGDAVGREPRARPSIERLADSSISRILDLFQRHMMIYVRKRSTVFLQPLSQKL